MIIAVSFQIFAFLEIPFMSTIHGYTIGMLLGFYNPLFYIFVTYIGLILMTNNKMRFPKWLKLKWTTYWIIVLSILFISASSGYYQSKNGWFVIGKDAWLSFDKWFGDFTSKNNAWLPTNTNGGVIGVFLYTFFATLTSGIGAFIIAVLSILVPLSLLFTGSAWGLYRKIIRKKMLTKRQKQAILEEEIEDETLTSLEITSPHYLEQNLEQQTTNKKDNVDLQFSDDQIDDKLNIIESNIIFSNPKKTEKNPKKSQNNTVQQHHKLHESEKNENQTNEHEVSSSELNFEDPFN